jgi:transposase-like protein
MFMSQEIDAAVVRVARRYSVDSEQLRQALERDSAEELGHVLGLPVIEAENRMAAIRRAHSVTADWGAGCKLLTDDVESELLAVIESL